MVRGNFGGNFLSIEKHWHCVLPSVHRAAHHMCRPLVKDAEAVRRVMRRICEQDVAGSIPDEDDAVQRLWASWLFGDDVAFYWITSISCCIKPFTEWQTLQLAAAMMFSIKHAITEVRLQTHTRTTDSGISAVTCIYTETKKSLYRRTTSWTATRFMQEIIHLLSLSNGLPTCY